MQNLPQNIRGPEPNLIHNGDFSFHNPVLILITTFQQARHLKVQKFPPTNLPIMQSKLWLAKDALMCVNIVE